jgi:hypothetical protein
MIAVVLDLVWMGRCDKQTAAMMHPFVMTVMIQMVVKSLDVSVEVNVLHHHHRHRHHHLARSIGSMIAVVRDLVVMLKCDKQTAAMMHPFVMTVMIQMVVKSLNVSFEVAVLHHHHRHRSHWR